MNKIIYYFLINLFFLSTFSSCKHSEGEYHSLKDKIEAESKDYHGVPVSSEEFIGTIKTLEITEGDHTFLIPERKSQITSYPCNKCHSKPVEQLKSVGEKKAHWDISLIHAEQKVMNCATCHNNNDMDHLKSLTSEKISFNQSYQVCAQCHSPQFADWKGGAHGKNIGGWAEPRAAMTCVNCHNPHQPKIKSKWPVRFNTQKVKERE